MTGFRFKVGFLEADFWDLADLVRGEFVGFEQGLEWERFGFEFSDNFDWNPCGSFTGVADFGFLVFKSIKNHFKIPESIKGFLLVSVSIEREGDGGLFLWSLRERERAMNEGIDGVWLWREKGT